MNWELELRLNQCDFKCLQVNSVKIDKQTDK